MHSHFGIVLYFYAFYAEGRSLFLLATFSGDIDLIREKRSRFLAERAPTGGICRRCDVHSRCCSLASSTCVAKPINDFTCSFVHLGVSFQKKLNSKHVLRFCPGGSRARFLLLARKLSLFSYLVPVCCLPRTLLYCTAQHCCVSRWEQLRCYCTTMGSDVATRQSIVHGGSECPPRCFHLELLCAVVVFLTLNCL